MEHIKHIGRFARGIRQSQKMFANLKIYFKICMCVWNTLSVCLGVCFIANFGETLQVGISLCFQAFLCKFHFQFVLLHCKNLTFFSVLHVVACNMRLGIASWFGTPCRKLDSNREVLFYSSISFYDELPAIIIFPNGNIWICISFERYRTLNKKENGSSC